MDIQITYTKNKKTFKQIIWNTSDDLNEIHRRALMDVNVLPQHITSIKIVRAVSARQMAAIKNMLRQPTEQFQLGF